MIGVILNPLAASKRPGRKRNDSHVQEDMHYNAPKSSVEETKQVSVSWLVGVGATMLYFWSLCICCASCILHCTPDQTRSKDDYSEHG